MFVKKYIFGDISSFEAENSIKSRTAPPFMTVPKPLFIWIYKLRVGFVGNVSGTPIEPSQQLQMFTEMDKIKYQHSLMLESLEESNKMFMMQQKEFTQSLNLMNKKIKEMSSSTEIVNQGMSKIANQVRLNITLMKNDLEESKKNLNENVQKNLEDMSKNVDHSFQDLIGNLTQKSAEISRYSQDLVQHSINEPEKAQKRLKTFYTKNKIITIALILNSVMMTGIVLYLLLRG
jgi:hypothetical protein